VRVDYGFRIPWLGLSNGKVLAINRNSFLTSKTAMVRSFRLLPMCEKTFILDKSARISGASTRT
jgi:hypothetical protein